MAVQDAQTPGREHEEPQAAGGDPQQVHRQVQAVALEARRQDHSQWSGQHYGTHDEDARHGGEQPRHGPCHPTGLVVASFA